MKNFSPLKDCPVCTSHDGRCRETDENLILCMGLLDAVIRVPGYRYVKPSKNGLWGIWAVDSEDQATSEEWRSRLDQRARENAAKERRRQETCMDDGERDRHYQRLLGSLDLAPLDRQDLHRRGLSDAQIAAAGFKSVEQWQRLDRAYPENLPGILRGGRSLNIQSAGYLCPVRNDDGLIVTCQVRSREGKPKYYWLTSATQANLDGARSHTLNGELPLAVFYPEHPSTQAIAMVEGTGAKPVIASARLGLVTIGAGGSNWDSSPETLQATLSTLSAKLGTKTIHFYPDAGMLDESHKGVRLRYRATWQLLERWGYLVNVQWWNQREKNHGDIDELDTLDQIREIDPAAFFALAGEDYQEGDRAIFHQIQQHLRKGLKPRGFAPSTPIASIQKSFIYQEGERLATWQAAQRKGYHYLLDNSGTGGGKSHNAGEARPQLFEADQLFYMTEQARNPTTPTLADPEIWALLEGRNAGKYIDPQGKSRPITKPGQIAIEPGNCSRTHLVHALRSKNVEGADANAVCYSCPLSQTCKLISGDGFGFKHNRRLALANPCVRSHPNSMPSEDFSYAGIAQIWEEFGESFSFRRDIYVNLNDVNATIAALARAGINAPLQPALNSLLELLERPSGRFGLTHEAIAQPLAPLLPKDLDLDPITEATAPNLEDLQPPDELDRESFNADQEQELATLKATYEQDKADLKNQKALEMAEAIAQPQLFGSDPKEAIATQYKALAEQQRGNYQAQTQTIKSKYQDLFKNANRTIRRATSQHSAETSQIIEAKVLKQWLLDFLSALTEGDRILSVRDGVLAIAIPDHRQRVMIRSSKFAVLLDATLTVEDAALMLGVNPSEIFVCTQEQPPTPNLEILQITDLGRLGMQRGADQQRRVAAIISHYKALDPTTQAIDFKKFDGDGAWWRDSRGSNDFLDCTTLLLVGTPCRNLNDLLTNYALLTGCRDKDDPGFKAFVDRKIRADFVQGIGRTRANRRLDEKLTVVILSPFDLGIPTTPVKAVEVCPEAGTKTERFMAAAKAAIATLTAQGQKITQTAVSQLVGYSQGYLSRHWQLLLSLLEIPNSKSNNFLDMAEESTMLEAIALESSPNDLIEALETGLYDWIPLHKWRDVLRSLTLEAQSKLIEALTFTLPETILREAIANAF